MESETLASPPVLKYDPRSAMAAGFCLMALFFDGLGWLLAVIGIILLRRAVFQPKLKWILAALALAPKILFLGVRSLSAPAGLSFTIEPWTLVTSSAIWSWSILLAAFGALLLYARPKPPRTPDPLAQTDSAGTPLLKLLGLVLVAGAVVMLLGLTDGFQRIQDAGNGRWALQHAVRGTRATFTADELASIEAIDTRSRSSSGFPVRVALTNGQTFSATTRSSDTFQELRKFAATAGLRPGAVRIRRRLYGEWTNGPSTFTLNDCVGTYEYAGTRISERSTFEFWLQNGRLAGKESFSDGQGRHARMLRDIKISDTGEMEFQESTYASAQELSKSTVRFSLRWSPQPETGRFTKDGLVVGLKEYRRQ